MGGIFKGDNQGGGGGSGETNTASNVGTGGVGVHKQKVGVDFEFKNINAGSNKLTVTDDVANSEIDIDVAEANITHDNLAGAGVNTHAQVDTHLASVANPHAVTAGQAGAAPVAHVTDVANPHAVTAGQVGLANVADLKVNLTATVAPISTDDSGSGYAVGSRWFDVTADKEYVCLDATVVAAVWTETTGAGGGATAQGKNLIINGNPTINQRGYVSGVATTAANQYTLDRWRVVTLGQALAFSNVANEVTLTLPIGGIEQVIEGLNIQSGTHTISFVATGDTVCTVDTVVKASGGTFTLTGGTNSTVKFSSAAGTGTVKLIQVELGSTATSFALRSRSTELAMCYRYYETTHIAESFVGQVQNTSLYEYIIVFMAKKRVIPTMTFTPLGAGAFPNTSPNIQVAGYSRYRVKKTATATGWGYYQFAWTADAEL